MVKSRHQGNSAVCQCAIKTGSGIVFPGCYPQVTVKELEQLWKLSTAKEKRTPLLEEAKMEKEGE